MEDVLAQFHKILSNSSDQNTPNPLPHAPKKGGKKKLQEEEEERKAHLLGSWSATNADHGTGKEDLIAERKNGDGGRQIEVLRHRSLLTSNARSEKQKNR